jgi:hypothetical protein
MKSKMVKNKSKLAIKLFIIVWVVLAVHIALKLTFNYWQPYVISNDKLQAISDFIDSHSIIKIISDKIFYIINVVFMILAGIQEWKFKKKYPIIIILICAILSALNDFTPINQLTDTIISLFTLIVLPLIINKKKWLTIILTFAFSYIFLFLSLWLEGFVNANDMNHIISTFLVFDYYIMLALNYFVFNLLRKENK